MRKLGTLAFLVTFATPLFAELTIVPIRGDLLFGADASYWTVVAVTNASAAPITVRRGDVYPAAGSIAPCGEPVTLILQPLESADVPTGCIGLYAYTLESDGPLRVDAVVTTLRPVRLPDGGNTSSIHYQTIATAHEWLPSHRQAFIPMVQLTSRTNIFVTNPNDSSLKFRLRVTRRSPLAPSRDEEHLVAPRTTALIALNPVDDTSCRLPLLCGHVYQLLFTADGPYYASASAVDRLGDALFSSPTLLDESIAANP